jgi:hypothetical protein
MKYSSKRVYKKRKSRRIKKLEGGIGGSTVMKAGKKVEIGQIIDFNSLNGFTVSDDVVKFKYTVKIDGDKIILSDISKFVSTKTIGVFLSIVNLSPTKFSSFDTMTRVFYNIDIPWSIMGDSHHLMQGQKETGNSMQTILNDMNNYFDPRFREGKYLGAIPEKIVFSDKTIVVTLKGEEQPTLNIPELFQDGFQKNVMNYFRQLIDPEDVGVKCPVTGPAIPTSGLKDIEESDKAKIQELIPGAKFEGKQLLTRSTLQKDASGKFYATAVEYKV